MEFSYEMRSQLAQQYSAGVAPRELGKSLGISRTAVLTQLRLMGVTLRNTGQARGTRMAKLTPEERQEAMKRVTAARLKKYPPQPEKARLPSRPALMARVRELEAGLKEYADHQNWGEKDGMPIFLAWEKRPDKWSVHPWEPARAALAAVAQVAQSGAAICDFVERGGGEGRG